MVLPAGPELIEDVRKAPDTVLSFVKEAEEVGIMRTEHAERILTQRLS